jgi:hypothetical protein
VKRLLKALERAGLVEMQGKPAEALPMPEPAPAPVAPPAPAREAPVRPAVSRREPSTDQPPAASADAPPGATASFELRPFDEIYAAAKVPESPFPAERLMRVLDGLNALEPAARKTAVLALDAADDAWTVEDTLLDAERKIHVLEATRADVEEQTRRSLEEARALVQEREKNQEASVARIRQQIADLEGLLEREVARATQDVADVKAAARSSKEACTRETARIDAEIGKLKRIAEIFRPVAPPAPPSA